MYKINFYLHWRFFKYWQHWPLAHPRCFQLRLLLVRPPKWDKQFLLMCIMVMFFQECEMIKKPYSFFFHRLCEGIFSGREYSVRKVKAYKKTYTMKSYIDKKSAKVFTRKRTFCVYNSLKSSTFYICSQLFERIGPTVPYMLQRLCKFLG